MENAIYIGLSRQTALRRELSLVANNIANANTTSFKRELSIYGVAPVSYTHLTLPTILLV